jgi:limonene 1,2-monooxygenase
MEEAMSIILRLFTETEPITYESEWFTLRNARAHLRPYTRPHMPIAVAAAQTPSGMVTAGRFGAAVLSLSRPRTAEATLKDFWGIAENTAAQYGQTMDRNEWRIVMHVHLAETREQAIAEARQRSGDYRHNYFETTLGQPVAYDVPNDQIIDHMVDSEAWCVGTPDDLIAAIHKLDEASGGFGGLLIQATEWATRDQVRRSYELVARYVKPHFQGSLVNLQASQADAEQGAAATRTMQEVAFARARQDYFERSGGQDSPFTRDIGR